MKKNSVMWGMACLLAAVLLIAGKLGYLGNFSVFTAIASVFLVFVMVKGILRMSFGTVFFSMAFLAILYAKQLNIENLVPWTVLLAALLATIGFDMIFHNAGWVRRIREHRDLYPENYTWQTEFTSDPDGETVHAKATFGGMTKYIHSDNLKEVDIDCTCSGMEIYFDKTEVRPHMGIVIHIHATMSGITLFIPKNWTVENHADMVVGGIDFKNQNEPDGSVNAVITGSMNMGGIEIIYI